MAESDESKVEPDEQADRAKKIKEAELVRKLPEKTEPVQEWGERIATGKQIATGGKSTAQPPSGSTGGGGD